MRNLPVRKMLALALAGTLATGSTLGAPLAKAAPDTSTPIKHVVVIFQENVSFDHYFGTYPNALNPAGSPKFVPLTNTPVVNGLSTDLLTHNPNAANPKRLDRSQAVTDDMDHEYKAEQLAFDSGKMDKFVENTATGKDKTLVMDYYDGNTVTAFWNYAQHFAMSDNSYNTVFGPSTPGALNLIAGQTHGAIGYMNGLPQDEIADNVVNGTVIGDPDPYYDTASNPKRAQAALSGKNVGDLLNEKGTSWGWFQGGFRDPKATHENVAGGKSTDYNPHHQPFQYYKSTSNPNHLPPSSPDKIGYTDQANHQYDLQDFWTATDAGNLPAVSYLKAANYQDGHAGYSDPIDEQNFVVDTINHLAKLPTWKDTAVIIAYDDSDGWYDHAAPPVINHSNDAGNDSGSALGTPDLGSYKNRAGYGPRLPLIVVSPYAKQNFVDHTLTDQSSILKFIEDNWNLGRIGDDSFDEKAGSLLNMFDFASGPVNGPVFLNPITGLQQTSGLTIDVNGTNIGGDIVPFINEATNRTMVPVRFIAQALGATVTWDAANQAVLINTPAYPTGIAQGGGSKVILNGKLLPDGGVIRNDRVFVPLRPIAEALQAVVNWDEGAMTARVTTGQH
jgi:phospholipase C